MERLKLRCVWPVALWCLAIAAPVSAQERPRVSLHVNAGVRSAPETTSDRFEFQENVETASATVTYPGASDLLVDAGAGVRLWKNLGAGVSFSRFTHEGSASVDASVPHPFVFGRPRQFSGESSGVARTETGVHVEVQYTIALSPRLFLTLSGGPSFLQVEQDLVTAVQYDETFPYDTATFTSTTTETKKGSATGFNVGADVAWMFSRHIGVGGFVRGTGGTVTLDASDSRRIEVNAGGVQGGGGIRVQF